MNLVETMDVKETSQTLFWILHFNDESLEANLHGLVFHVIFQRMRYYSSLAAGIVLPLS